MHAYPYYVEFGQALRVREGHSAKDSKGGSKMRAGRGLGRGRSWHGENNEKACRNQGMSAGGEVGMDTGGDQGGWAGEEEREH